MVRFGRPSRVAPVSVRTPWGITTQVHPLVVDVFREACEEAALSPWRPRRIDGWVIRPIGGTSTPSLHSWALAWDLFATPPGVPPPGGVWTPLDGMTLWFAAGFIKRGFTWGATWKGRPDVPHIEWAGPPPR